MNIETNRKCLELLGKAVGPRKGPRTHYETRTDIINLIKEDNDARRFFESVQKLLLHLSWKLVREQSENGIHGKVEKMLDEHHRKIKEVKQ